LDTRATANHREGKAMDKVYKVSEIAIDRKEMQPSYLNERI
jgi:hypothetical protein